MQLLSRAIASLTYDSLISQSGERLADTKIIPFLVNSNNIKIFYYKLSCFNTTLLIRFYSKHFVNPYMQCHSAI